MYQEEFADTAKDIYLAFTGRKRYNTVINLNENTKPYLIQLIQQVYQEIYSTQITSSGLEFLDKFFKSCKQYSFQKDSILLARILLLRSFSYLEYENIAKSVLELFFRSLPPRIYNVQSQVIKEITEKYDGFEPQLPSQYSKNIACKLIPCPKSATAMIMMTEGHLAHHMDKIKLQTETPCQCALRLAVSFFNAIPDAMKDSKGQLLSQLFHQIFQSEVIPSTPMHFFLGLEKNKEYFTSCYILELTKKLEANKDPSEDIVLRDFLSLVEDIQKTHGGMGIYLNIDRHQDSTISDIIKKVPNYFSEGKQRTSSITVNIPISNIYVLIHIRSRDSNNLIGNRRHVFPAIVITDEFRLRVEKDRLWYFVAPDAGTHLLSKEYTSNDFELTTVLKAPEDLKQLIQDHPQERCTQSFRNLSTKDLEGKLLDDLTGAEWSLLYNALVKENHITGSIPARILNDAIAIASINTGTPFTVNIDTINATAARSKTSDLVSKGTNLCTEIVQPTIAVEGNMTKATCCVLSSINMARHLKASSPQKEIYHTPWNTLKLSEERDSQKQFYFSEKYPELTQIVDCFKSNPHLDIYDLNHLAESVFTTAIILNSLIDNKDYPSPILEKINKKQRPMGIGMQGYYTSLIKAQKKPSDSLNPSSDLQYPAEKTLYSLNCFMSEIAKVASHFYMKTTGISLPSDTSQTLTLTQKQHIIRQAKLLRCNDLKPWETIISPIANELIGSFDLTQVKKVMNQVLGKDFPLCNSFFITHMPTSLSASINDVSESFNKIFNIIHNHQFNKNDMIIKCLELYAEVGDGISWNPHNFKQHNHKFAHEMTLLDNIKIMLANNQSIDQSASMNYHVPKNDPEVVKEFHLISWYIGTKTTYYTRHLRKKLNEDNCTACQA